MEFCYFIPFPPVAFFFLSWKTPLNLYVRKTGQLRPCTVQNGLQSWVSYIVLGADSGSIHMQQSRCGSCHVAQNHMHFTAVSTGEALKPCETPPLLHGNRPLIFCRVSVMNRRCHVCGFVTNSQNKKGPQPLQIIQSVVTVFPSPQWDCNTHAALEPTKQ